jgi:DNA-binding LytR/AlgR family response regulator
MQPYFFIRTEKQYVKISYPELICIESVGNYVSITTDNGTYMAQLSIKQLEKLLPREKFCRVSRSSIVSLDRIVSFDRDCVLLKDKRQVSFGDSFRRELEQRVNIVMSDVRERPKSLMVDTEGIRQSIN